MSGPHRRASRVDNNQAEIVRALRAVGIAAEIIKKPLDLLISYNHGKETALAEVKNLNGFNRYTKDQIDFIARWPGKIFEFTSPQQAVEEVLKERMT